MTAEHLGANAPVRTPRAANVWLRPITRIGGGAAALLALFAALDWLGTDYAYLAAYTVLQFVVLATAWNILGGYAGYVNFGSAGFFALGVYTTVVIYKTVKLPLLVSLPIAATVAALVGLGMAYLTLRLRGVFFSIATLALAVVLHTLIVNWEFVGGSRGVYVLRPNTVEPFGSYTRFLFTIMLGLAIFSVLVARAVEKSWLGTGLATIRDDETAAECAGVATLRLKLIAAVLSAALMGMAGAPFPYFITYVDPNTAFNLSIAVNTIAMPLIGGTTTWLGPVIGAVLLGSLQQITTVTISSALNLMIVGVLLVVFISLAPNGIVGLFSHFAGRTK
ncbi:MAG TPA: branched-chain amino acid ABC transporter permease [Hyphomicrobiaceae bacterium]|nr:branched-chain amino acid ABC transporter permease [Hyphomicrobiaceae bacterium]